MKSLKKFRVIGAVFLTSVLLFTTVGPDLAYAATAPGGIGSNQLKTSTKSMDMDPVVFKDVFVEASPAFRTLVDGNIPATFSGISYELADGVVAIDSGSDEIQMEAVENISTAAMRVAGKENLMLTEVPNRIIAEGGFIDMDILDEALNLPEVKNGTVVVDEATGTAFKVVAPAEFSGAFELDEGLSEAAASLSGTYMVKKPQIHEVLKDFTLPEQTITMTPGNISMFAPTIDPVTGEETGSVEQYATVYDEGRIIQASSKSGDLHFMKEKDMFIRFNFGGKGSGPSVEKGGVTTLKGIRPEADLGDVPVSVSGSIAFGNFDLDAHYTAFSGYGFGFVVGQAMDLEVVLQFELDEEIKIPLFGFTVPFGVGNADLGIFLIIELDGNIRIEIEIWEYTKNFVGLGGQTVAYVPVSFGPRYSLREMKLDGDIRIYGEMDSKIKVGPLANLDIFGFKVVEVGAFIGIGATAKGSPTGKAGDLDLRLYGFFDIYCKLLGKKFTLFHKEITFIQRKQRDTGGYRVDIDEAFVAPGRVGGRIFAPPAEGAKDTEWVPMDDIEYKIIVEKAKGKDEVYPIDGSWAKTKWGGEFFQGDGLTGPDAHGYDFGKYNPGQNVSGNSGIKGLTGDDKVSVKFRVGGKEYTSVAVSPTLPFTTLTIDEADYFNDYVTGSVDKKRMTDWTKDPRKTSVEDRCVWVSPPAGIKLWIVPGIISTDWLPYKDREWYKDMLQYWNYGTTYRSIESISYKNPYGPIYEATQVNSADAITDATGAFDTRIPYDDPPYGTPGMTEYGNYNPQNPWLFGNWIPDPENPDAKIVNPYFSVTDHTSPGGGKFEITMIYNKDYRNLIKASSYFEPTMSLQFTRAIFPVEGSQSKSEFTVGENEYVVDSMQYDEYIWIINPNGERTVADDEFSLRRVFFSAADNKWSATDYNDGYKLVESTVGNGTSTTLFSERVTVEWVWQKHPDPVAFSYIPSSTSPNMTGNGATLSTAGGEIQIMASGILPAYYLEGAPEGVTIDKDTGVITVPSGMSPGDYKFRITAVQEYRGTPVKYQYKNKTYEAPDYKYYRHDPLPAVSEDFTLTLAKAAPVIEPAEQTSHGYEFTVSKGRDELSVPIKTISGDPPITWSLISIDAMTPIPNFVSIDSKTGVLRIGTNGEVGWYEFYISAENEVGASVPEYVGVRVIEARDAPRITTTNYVNEMDVRKEYTMQFAATGSPPLTWSLEPYGSGGVPEDARIDRNTGRLTIADTIAPGTYTFLVMVSNDVGSDSLVFTITVRSSTVIFSQPSIPVDYNADPVLYRSYDLLPSSDAVYALAVSEPGQGQVQGVLLSSAPGAAPASPGEGTDESVTATPQEKSRSLKDRAKGQLDKVQTTRQLKAAETGGEDPFTPMNLETWLEIMPPPMNNETITWSHKRDAYTDARGIVNGTEFLSWASVPWVVPANEPVNDHYQWNTFYPDHQIKGSREALRDDAPRSDMYHPMYELSYRADLTVVQGEPSDAPPAMDEENIDEAEELFFMMLSGSSIGLGEPGSEMQQWMMNTGFDTDGFDYNMDLILGVAADTSPDPDAGAPPAETTYQYLYYGEHLDEMTAQKSGRYVVYLDNSTGYTVPGEYFITLKENKDMSLVFIQDGVTITFDGKDLKRDVFERLFLDLSYTPNSLLPFLSADEYIMKASGTSGGEYFTYSFSHHGELPCPATFEVETGIKEGTAVNVYKFDRWTDKFVPVTEKVTVGPGGVVTYRNDTMSDYLITTNTLADDVLMTPQADTGGVNPLFIVLIILVAVAAGAGIIFIIIRRKKPAGGEQAAVYSSYDGPQNG